MRSSMSEDHASEINALHEGTWAATLGMRLETATRDGVTATLDLTKVHLQPFGLVHGGVYASVVESLASVGAGIDARARGKNIVGLENHTSFVRGAREGKLSARALPLTRGQRTQLWEVVIENDEAKTVATGRVRFLVVEPTSEIAGAPLG